jgi:hypothetical protein
MEDEDRRIETCLFIGSAEASGLKVDLLLPDVTVVTVQTRPPQSDDLWSSLGFASEVVFINVQNLIDVVITIVYNVLPNAETVRHLM